MASKMVTNILQGNAKFAASYTAPAPLMKMREMWQKTGGKGTVILSCSDPRVIPEKFMGLEAGPTAVIRNAGGRAMDSMRTLHVLNAINPLGLVVVVHHTDCGTTHVKDGEVRDFIRKNGGESSFSNLEEVHFGEINDLEASIREDVKLIKDDPSFGTQVPAVVGMLYEVETGKLKVLDEQE